MILSCFIVLLQCEQSTFIRSAYNVAYCKSLCPSSSLPFSSPQVWTRSSLTGYSQHDAHEFFITAIEMLHKDSRSEEAFKSRQSFLHLHLFNIIHC